MNLTDLYKIAKEHKNTHKHCGAEPYLDYNFLFNFLQKEKMNNNLDNILELGSGVGFTAIVINLATPFSLIDSVENNQEHVDFAKKWIKDLKLNLHEVAPSVNNINIIQADVHTVLPYLESNKYDLIFFDVYGPKQKYLIDFERILKRNGILYTLNSHLKSAEQEYFEKLDNSKIWKKITEFADTRIYRKI